MTDANLFRSKMVIGEKAGGVDNPLSLLAKMATSRYNNISKDFADRQKHLYVEKSF